MSIKFKLQTNVTPSSFTDCIWVMYIYVFRQRLTTPINFKTKILTKTIRFFIAIFANTRKGIVHQDTFFIWSTGRIAAIWS
jgi:hypothetical protein